jgi:methanogenic corrinoid protein MtbC1
MAETERLMDNFEYALLSLDRLAAQNLLAEATATMTPIQFVEQVIAPTLERIGHGWEEGTVALSQIYMSGRICEAMVDAILPPSSPDRKDRPKMAIALLEDHHALGKRIVYATLRAAGFELMDYGDGVQVDDLVQCALADDIKLLLISTLMLRSALRIKEVTTKLKAANSNIKVVVGGASFIFDPNLWQEVGADAMGHSATEAIAIVNKLAGGAA